MRYGLITLGLVSAALFGAPEVQAQDHHGARLIPTDDDAPPIAGQMTETAAQAKRLFDAERWGEAAMLFERVAAGAAKDDEGNRQIAQYHLAVALYRLQFFQASYAIFSSIVDKTNHLKFNETLLWLAKLAAQLPEPADVVERVGKYTPEQLAVFDNSKQREQYWQLNYLLGRYKYRNRDYDKAIELFGKVGTSGRHYLLAQFFTGISYVQVRKSVPATKAFQSVVQALDAGGAEVEDETRMRDLAYLSLARTYYSASIRFNEKGVPTIDATKISAAIGYWNQVDMGSEYWLDALFEESWAYFMAGDYSHVLGNIHTIESPYFPNAFYPEADVLEAVVSYKLCHYDAAMTSVARMRNKYIPVKAELETLASRFTGDDDIERKYFDLLREVRAGKANLSPVVKPVIENMFSDRQLLRNLEYVRVLDEEEARFKKAPEAFRNSSLGGDILDSIMFARDLTIRNAGTLARERYRRYLDELNEHLRNGTKILVDVTAEQRRKLNELAGIGYVVQRDAYAYGTVRADDEHFLWPFDGEHWRDELGFYRQVVKSNCGK